MDLECCSISYTFQEMTTKASKELLRVGFRVNMYFLDIHYRLERLSVGCKRHMWQFKHDYSKMIWWVN